MSRAGVPRSRVALEKVMLMALSTIRSVGSRTSMSMVTEPETESLSRFGRRSSV